MSSRFLQASLKFFGWSLAVLLGLYLLFILVIVPFLLPFALGKLASKHLGRPVKIQQASLNPFNSRLTLYGLSVLDEDHTEMVGFSRLWVDLDAPKLLQKTAHIESIGLQDLRLRVVLRPDNRVNLQDLVPSPTPLSTPSVSPTQTPLPTAQATPQATLALTEAASLPDIVVDEFLLQDADITFTDRSIGQGFLLRLQPLQGTVTGVSTRPDCAVKVALKGVVDGKGSVTLNALVRPFLARPYVEATFALGDYAARALTPYVGRYTGRAVKEGGRVDLQATYHLENDRLVATHRLLMQDFDFGEKVQSKDAMSLPFGLALSLLKDGKGRIDIKMPVEGDVTDPKFRYFKVLGKVCVNFFKKLVFAPFKMLGKLVPFGGGKDAETKDIGAIYFAAGSSTLSKAERAKAAHLSTILASRPKIGMEIRGGYDPNADWKGIRARVLEARIAEKLAKKKDATPLSVVENLFKDEFGSDAMKTLRHELFPDPSGDPQAYLEAMRERLIQQGEKNEGELEALARARGQTVLDALLAAGVPPTRVKLGGVHETLAAVGKVPTDFTVGK